MNIYEQAKAFFADPEIRAQAINDLAEIIRIPSVASDREGIYPYGAECAKALDCAQALAEKYGFKVENHEYHCMSVLFGEGEKEIGIVCHLDVVPAGDGWSVPPFELTVNENLLMGRGTHDDKGPFIQSLYTLRFFKENNIKLPFAVRLILGSDEEVGSSDLEYFVTVRKAPSFSFTPDSSFPVCIGEKGILSVSVDFPELPEIICEINGGTVSNAVPGAAYAIVNRNGLPEAEGITLIPEGACTKVLAAGREAHAAMPESGENAINRLTSYLIANGIIDKESALGLVNRSTAEYFGKTLGIDASNDAFGYLTCVGSVIKTKGRAFSQCYNIRYLPDTPYVEIVSAIENAVSSYGGRVNIGSQSDGYFVSADDERIKALTNACESVLGKKCEPYTMGGGTYARWLANTVAFGSSIEGERDYLGDEKGGAHQRDEFMSIREFFDGMLIYSLAIANLSEI